MLSKRTNVIGPLDPQAAVSIVRMKGKRVLTFLGFSGSGYEDSDRVRKTVEGILAHLDPESVLINAGGTAVGIGAVYAIAKDRGFSTLGIVSALAIKQKAELSSHADEIYLIADDTWGGQMPEGGLSPTSVAMVAASDEMIAIGGDEIARDELSAAKAEGKPVRYIRADMNHAAAKRKARMNGAPEPVDFRGAAYHFFKPPDAPENTIGRH